MSRDGSAGSQSPQRNRHDRRVVFDWTRFDGPTEAITEATAQVTDRQPPALQPLQQYVDVDSLKRLLRESAATEVAFEYEQVSVSIDTDGKLVIGLSDQREP